MSTTATTRPTSATRPASPSQGASPSSDDRPTVPTVPTRRAILHAVRTREPAAQPERSPFAGWRGLAQTEEMPAAAIRARPSDTGRPASGARRSRRSRVSTPAKSTGSRERGKGTYFGTKGLRRHLRAALAGILIAAALLTGLQLYAAAGISSARQAALATAQHDAAPAASAVPLSGQSTSTPASPMSGQSDPKPDWVTEDTHAPYDRTNPAASPLDLPRCTTSPDTPLPCLATISPSQTRAVVLEEDASLTALVRR